MPAFETLLVWIDPLLRRVGYDRLDRPFVAVEKVTKGLLLDSQTCGQCIVGFTGLSCPMNCPKKMRNGPCGGVRADGNCEVNAGDELRLGAGLGRQQAVRDDGYPIQVVQPPVDNRLIGTSAWLREVRTGRSTEVLT